MQQAPFAPAARAGPPCTADSSRHISVVLHAPGGKRHKVLAPPGTRVYDLKQQVAGLLQVPCECQEIFVGTDVACATQPLANHRVLSDFQNDGGDLDLCVRMRLDGLKKALLDATRPHVRLRALEVAAGLSAVTGQSIISAVAESLEDNHGEIRKKALETLGAIAKWSDKKGAVAEASARLADTAVVGPGARDSTCRQAALAVFAELWDNMSESSEEVPAVLAATKGTCKDGDHDPTPTSTTASGPFSVPTSTTASGPSAPTSTTEFVPFIPPTCTLSSMWSFGSRG